MAVVAIKTEGRLCLFDPDHHHTRLQQRVAEFPEDGKGLQGIRHDRQRERETVLAVLHDNYLRHGSEFGTTRRHHRLQLRLGRVREVELDHLRLPRPVRVFVCR